MKLILHVIIFIVFCPLANAQREKALLSKWNSNVSVPAAIPDDDFMSAKKGAVLYFLSNDEMNLCVDMKIKETLEQSNILQMGMTIWLNTDGKSRKIIGVRYPIGARFSRTQGMVKPTPLSLANTIQLVGFGNPQESRLPSDNPDNVRGSVKYDDDGNLIYHLIIPLAKIPDYDPATMSGSGTLWTLGIEYGVPPVMTAQAGRGPAPAGGMPRGGGGSPGGRGGGMSPGGARPSTGGSETVFTPELIWIKELKLASK